MYKEGSRFKEDSRPIFDRGGYRAILLHYWTNKTKHVLVYRTNPDQKIELRRFPRVFVSFQRRLIAWPVWLQDLDGMEIVFRGWANAQDNPPFWLLCHHGNPDLLF
jgi:hypothetical protein